MRTGSLLTLCRGSGCFRFGANRTRQYRVQTQIAPSRTGGGLRLLIVPVTIGTSLRLRRGDPVAGQRRMRWYNPALRDFEWRETPETDEEALAVLAGSPHTPACRETYREWRALGAGIAAALIRAGEAAREADRG